MDSLYIITKQEFTSLYRFGKIPLISSKIIKTEDLSNEEINSKIYQEFLSLPYFVGDEEYLIISFENVFIDNIWLEIECVSEIIPLTKAARSSIEMKFDAKLDFKPARFEPIIHKVEEQIDLQERYRGAKAFWNLCQVKSDFKPLLSSELIESSYNKRINATKSNEFKDDFFIHLLVYDRYEFFPNSDLGYFYDTGEIFAHSKGKPSFKGSSLYLFLENNKEEFSGRSFIHIAQIISGADEVIKFTEQLTVDGLKQYIASALFLKFKNDLAERDTIKGSETGRLIGEIRKEKEFINELNIAIYLTGLFFGYNKFYDDLYELSDLKIFKKKSNPAHEKIIIDKRRDKEDSSLKPFVPKTEQPEVKSSKLEVTEQNTVHVERDETEINEKEVTEGFSDVKKQILDNLLNMLEEEKGTFEIKTDRLNELKKILTPLSVEKNISKKDDVVQILKEKFSDSVNVTAKGNNFIISGKLGGDLFANA